MITRHLHVTETIFLRSNQTLEDTKVVQGGTLIGRVLFTEPTLVLDEGNNITIRNNHFISITNPHVAIRPFTPFDALRRWWARVWR